MESGQDNSNLVCIECSRGIKSIFKVYSDGFKDIIECSNCRKLVDSYVECEYSVIFIDLLLLKEKTYRHLIINKEIKKHVLAKILITFLLCDAYLYWFNLKNRQFESIRSNDQQLFYELEWNFYFMLIKAFINSFIYSSIILSLCQFDYCLTYKKLNVKCIQNGLFQKQLIKALILSSFGKLIVFPLVIWNPNEVFFNLALFFTYLSNSKALAVVKPMNGLKSLIIVSLAAILTNLFSYAISSINLNLSI